MAESIKLKEGVVVVLLCVLLLGAYSFGSYIYFRTTGIEISDTARFGWDTMEYQSMAVNFAAGHGLKYGAIEEFSYYKFNPKGNAALGDATMSNFESFLDIGSRGGSYNFYRTPGYPVFLGVLYKIFGVSPKVAKIAQVFLIVLVASFLPYVGFAYWRLSGFAAGAASGGFLMRLVYQYKMYDSILTEPLIILSVFLIVLTFIYWEKKRTSAATAVLGVVMGAGILVKGSLMFTPVLTGFFLLYLIKQKVLNPRQFVAFVLSVSLVIFSWSIFASVKEGRPVFISTQGEALLLDSNSMASKDGLWHNKHDVFYDNPEIQKLPALIKVARFYLSHRDIVPSIFINKVNEGFNNFLFRVAMLFLIYEMILKTIHFFDGTEGGGKAVWHLKTILSFIMLINLGWILIVLFMPLFEGCFSLSWVHTLSIIQQLIPGSALLIFIFASVYFLSCMITRRIIFVLPASFIILFLNFLLITLIFCGESRFVNVISFIFIITTMQAIFSYSMWLYKILLDSWRGEYGRVS
ncbi:MAG: hypothetical protein HQK98_07145 [Nitrospirae bacterium]|nr:hypothetical protein [Nitrospirota bacterium]